MATQEEKNAKLLRMLESTPDTLLREDSSDDIFKALQASAKAGTGTDVAPNAILDGAQDLANNVAPGAATTQQQGGNNTPPGGNTTGIPGSAENTANKYAQSVQPIPDNRVVFKLKELFDPELVIMILDMLLSWGGSLLLDANGIECTSEDLRADEFQREILLKAFKPGFDTWEVGTKNPMAAMGMAMLGVYGKNVMEIIRVNNALKKAQEKGDKTIETKKRKLPKYVKDERKPRTIKVKPPQVNNNNSPVTNRFI